MGGGRATNECSVRRRKVLRGGLKLREDHGHAIEHSPLWCDHDRHRAGGGRERVAR